jgi:hypothetical protein
MTRVKRHVAVTITVGLVVVVLGASALAVAIGHPASSPVRSAPASSTTSPATVPNQTPAPSPSGPCAFAVQGGADFVRLMKGIDQHTVTRADVVGDLARVAGHLGSAATTATGKLRHASADGSLRARQTRAMLSTPGPQPRLTAASRKLAGDFNTIHQICLR